MRQKEGDAMSDASEAIGTLPLVRSDGKGRDFWHVAPTGEYDVDFSLGRGYAIEAVEMAVASRFPGLVGWILEAMGKNEECRSVERGFRRGLADLACVTMSLRAGRPARVLLQHAVEPGSAGG